MKIEIDLNACVRHNLTPDEYCLLYLLYHKDFERIEKVFGKLEAVIIRNRIQMMHPEFILNREKVSFKQTILSSKNVCKLLNIREEEVRFIEFYNLYPVRVGSRVLRAADVDTVIGKKHETKYLKRVKTKEQHEQAKKAIAVFVAKQKQTGKLAFLPAMETVLNNSMWESWKSLIDVAGTEQKDWNEESI
jgi:hypothetical protein